MEDLSWSTCPTIGAGDDVELWRRVSTASNEKGLNDVSPFVEVERRESSAGEERRKKEKKR